MSVDSLFVALGAFLFGLSLGWMSILGFLIFWYRRHKND